MTASENEQATGELWQVVGGSGTWRAGYAHGCAHASLVMNLRGEKLNRSEMTELATRLIAAMPRSELLAGQWASESATKPASGFAGIVNLLLLTIRHLQNGEGIPVFETGRILALQEVQAEVQVPTTVPSYQLTLNITNWLMQACGMLRAGTELGNHGLILKNLLANLRSQFGVHQDAYYFAKTADQLGIPIVEMPGRVLQFGQGHLTSRMLHSVTAKTSNVATHLARLKYYSAPILAEAGIPVPTQYQVANEASALQAAEEIGYPVVVKPGDQDGGLAVSTNLATPHAVRQAFAKAAAVSTSILVEQHITGRDFRITVFNGKVIGVMERQPLHVIGDGQTSMLGLIEQINSDPMRQGVFDSVLKQVPTDTAALATLVLDGLTWSSIPVKGERVLLRCAHNIRNGRVPLDVMDQLHPDNGQLAIRAANALDLDMAGVDLLMPDIAQSWLETGAAICDVNTSPNIFTTCGKGNFASILASLVQGNGRIPVVVIAGAAPDSPLERLVTKGIALSGMTIGYLDSSGARVGKERLTPGPAGTFVGGRMLMRDPRIEALVMLVNDDSVLESGLPFARYDVLVIAGEGIGADTVRALLPACDGKVAVLRGNELPLAELKSATGATWEENLHPGEAASFLQSEIKLRAKAHLAGSAD